jgi:hypothetical protein
MNNIINITLTHGDDRWELYVNGDYVGSDDQINVEDVLRIVSGKTVVLSVTEEVSE